MGKKQGERGKSLILRIDAANEIRDAVYCRHRCFSLAVFFFQSQILNTRMQELSTVDGFAEINESLAEMGFYYIQHHAQDAAPNVLNLSINILAKLRETCLRTKDLEDSIAMVKSMKKCGSPIIYICC
ncbi:PREDICTED: uncharacterized protein LOC104733577 [Camelina sativa]|uniref:Uncharacterized protein LOC104733577 n=1 Tax=Camelina sativa TaxID=90675 RepID=A0ABM0V664_CAMSA|nr:PREDICTED: uncharacterized protein LOC104733577 [Camelina sativa]